MTGACGVNDALGGENDMRGAAARGWQDRRGAWARREGWGWWRGMGVGVCERDAGMRQGVERGRETGWRGRMYQRGFWAR